MIELGTRVKDSLTGFGGVAIGPTTYLYGCIQVWVQPAELKDGKPLDPIWIDEQRLMNAGAQVLGQPGGPQDTPPPRPHG